MHVCETGTKSNIAAAICGELEQEMHANVPSLSPARMHQQRRPVVRRRRVEYGAQPRHGCAWSADACTSRGHTHRTHRSIGLDRWSTCTARSVEPWDRRRKNEQTDPTRSSACIHASAAASAGLASKLHAPACFDWQRGQAALPPACEPGAGIASLRRSGSDPGKRHRVIDLTYSLDICPCVATVVKNGIKHRYRMTNLMMIWATLHSMQTPNNKKFSI
jgi:hypothetical protein